MKSPIGHNRLNQLVLAPLLTAYHELLRQTSDWLHNDSLGGEKERRPFVVELGLLKQ
ncbi:hypothetical protein QTO31_17535 [Chloroflexus sp. MS-CIW-1]|uniref:hypothetical protein n=1 Tax=unclassified Chloroflexus TaxID=2633855 RepID=UPI000A8861B0|nr:MULTISPECIES: hypothetical protein [unclassified Chloroflexus]MBO9347692.1 hypothetical protein [Chloroflexus sp.]MDN5273772.1 hypothetical protein [Chloroflexus sp. MS-CIW-1]